MIPPRILDHGSVRIAWHEAVLTRLTIIDDSIFPEGTPGWFRRTSRHRGTFLPNQATHGIQIHANDLDISSACFEVEYQLTESENTPW